MLDWRKQGNEGVVLSLGTQMHTHTHAHTDANARLRISAFTHLLTPELMQDLIHKPHVHTHKHTHTPSEYISVSWPPTQLSRLTFCLVFFLSHTHSASSPRLCLALSVLPTRQTSQTLLPTEFLWTQNATVLPSGGSTDTSEAYAWKT